jgi:hypothetical protein
MPFAMSCNLFCCVPEDSREFLVAAQHVKIFAGLKLPRRRELKQFIELHFSPWVDPHSLS